MENQLRKKIILLLLILFVGHNTFSQSTNSKNKNSDWQVLKQDSLVKVTYKYGNCNLINDGINKEEVYLKFENLSQNSITVNWELELKYGSKCFNCLSENDELKFSLSLEPKEIIEGKCGERNNYQLNVFSKFWGSESESKLSDFNINRLDTKINSLK